MDMLIFGLLIAAIMMSFHLTRVSHLNKQYQGVKDSLINDLHNTNKDLDAAILRYNQLQELQQHQQKSNNFKIDELQSALMQKSENLATFQERVSTLTDKLNNQKGEFIEVQKQYQAEFENIATRILKTNTVDFSDSHRKSLDTILTPLKDRIVDFEKLVKETWDKEQRESIQLKEEVKNLTQLNKTLSDETTNLTKALKGDNKQQGNWGEMVLESILERSGLQKGINYKSQYSTTNNSGAKIQPDIVVMLPEDKHIIIDAKVSLVAFEKLTNSETDESRIKYAKAHIQSVKSHISELHAKNYQHGTHLNSPDFILMFLPIEASFSVAVKEDDSIFNFAWEKNIVIVSPSTLLATLMTIASIWRQENQSQNTREIARLGGIIYDKIAGIINDIDKVKGNLDTISKNIDSLSTKINGRGGIASSADKMKSLGASPNKVIDAKNMDSDYTLEENSTFVK